MKPTRLFSLLGVASMACAFAVPTLILTVPGVAHADDDLTKVETNYGIGVRGRRVFMPEWAFEVFADDAPGGGQNNGFGLELIREKGNQIISLGVEYDPLNATDGIWVEKDKPPPAFGVDYVEFRDLEWITVDVSFMWQTGIIGKMLSLRYGAGLGVGLIRGEVHQSDRLCANNQIESCTIPDPAGMQDKVTDLPPVFPVVNVIMGLQFRPIHSIAINLEGGIRTVPFVGVTGAVMF